MFASLADLPSHALPRLARRASNAHKGDFGSGLLIGGSRGMAGAIALAGLAALRAGAGLVRLAVPDQCLSTVAAFSPCFMTIPLADDKHGRLAWGCLEQLEQPFASASCVAVGPGLGQSVALRRLVKRLVRTATCPLVIDADGLNNLKESSVWYRRHSSPLVLTPHPGEWARLSGIPAHEREAQCRAAVEFAKNTATIVVLKGAGTMVTDGQSVVWNTTGTPAMATGGSGDVLTGLITALICQGFEPRDAAHLGVYVHGMAAEEAQHALQSHVVLPTELIAFVPQAMRQVIG